MKLFVFNVSSWLNRLTRVCGYYLHLFNNIKFSGTDHNTMWALGSCIPIVMFVWAVLRLLKYCHLLILIVVSLLGNNLVNCRTGHWSAAWYFFGYYWILDFWKFKFCIWIYDLEFFTWYCDLIDNSKRGFSYFVYLFVFHSYMSLSYLSFCRLCVYVQGAFGIFEVQCTSSSQMA